MRVLVVEGDRDSSRTTIDALDAAGHEVLRCYEPGQPAFPCAALLDESRCPLTVGAVDVAVAVRDDASRDDAVRGSENGMSCALRHFVPVVAVGHRPGSPLVPFAAEVVEGADAVEAALWRATSAPMARHEQLAVAAARHVLERHGRPDVDIDARVTRDGDTVRVELRTGADVPKAVGDIASVRAASAIRAIDQMSRVINVVVEPAVAP